MWNERETDSRREAETSHAEDLKLDDVHQGGQWCPRGAALEGVEVLEDGRDRHGLELPCRPSSRAVCRQSCGRAGGILAEAEETWRRSPHNVVPLQGPRGLDGRVLRPLQRQRQL